MRKDIHALFKCDMELAVANFLDVTIDLHETNHSGNLMTIQYTSTLSPTIHQTSPRNYPKAVNKRLNEIFCNKSTQTKAPLWNSALLVNRPFIEAHVTP